jgi:NAD+ synthase
MNYIVAGTTNRTEFLLGDFCKFGDGGTDLECISHLYKTQVYEIGRLLGAPQEIIDRTPSPDTFSLAVSDKDFYFCLPFDLLDPLLYGWEYKVDKQKLATELNLTTEQIDRVFRDFESKHASTEHIRQLPYAIERDWSQYSG